MEATGFGDGLFEGPELDSKSITDKDAKINFLTKLITLTEMMIGEELDVKPNKIVAGHEPEKTNGFLQAMFQAASSGIDSRPYVCQILGIAGDGAEGEDPDAQQAEEDFEQEAQRQQQEMMEAEAAKKKQQKVNAKEKAAQQEAQRVAQEEKERKDREAKEQANERKREKEMAKQRQREDEEARRAQLLKDQQDDDDEQKPEEFYEQP